MKVQNNRLQGDSDNALAMRWRKYWHDVSEIGLSDDKKHRIWSEVESEVKEDEVDFDAAEEEEEGDVEVEEVDEEEEEEEQ